MSKLQESQPFSDLRICGFAALGCLADGLGVSAAAFVAVRVVMEIDRFAGDGFSSLCAELILQSDTAAREFKANQALCNQESVDRGERQLLDAGHFLNSVEPSGIFVGGGFSCCIPYRVTVQNCQTVLFKLAGL